jgi:hypothetical protein
MSAEPEDHPFIGIVPSVRTIGESFPSAFKVILSFAAFIVAVPKLMWIDTALPDTEYVPVLLDPYISRTMSPSAAEPLSDMDIIVVPVLG